MRARERSAYSSTFSLENLDASNIRSINANLSDLDRITGSLAPWWCGPRAGAERISPTCLFPCQRFNDSLLTSLQTLRVRLGVSV